MNMVKLFNKKAEEDGDQEARAQKSKPVKKSAQQPVKPKKTESTKKVAKKSEEPGVPLWNRFRQYLREVSYELRKVIWPSRKETIGSTAVVLVIVILAGAFLGLVDLILSRFVRLFIG